MTLEVRELSIRTFLKLYTGISTTFPKSVANFDDIYAIFFDASFTGIGKVAHKVFTSIGPYMSNKSFFGAFSSVPLEIFEALFATLPRRRPSFLRGGFLPHFDDTAVGVTGEEFETGVFFGEEGVDVGHDTAHADEWFAVSLELVALSGGHVVVYF